MLARRLQRKRDSPEFRGCRVPIFQVRSACFMIAQSGLDKRFARIRAYSHSCLEKTNVFKKKGCGVGRFVRMDLAYRCLAVTFA